MFQQAEKMFQQIRIVVTTWKSERELNFCQPNPELNSARLIWQKKGSQRHFVRLENCKIPAVAQTNAGLKFGLGYNGV